MPGTDSAESLVLVHVPPDRIAPHPDNPRRKLGDLTELARSIGTLGVLEPLLLVPVDAFNAAAGDDAITARGIEWVAVAGHRRRAGAAKAKVATVPAVPRPDLADRVVALEVMLTENSQRNDLTPIEEAHAFRQLRDAGRSQREIAARLGRAQSHVSKRLALLDLPEAAQTAVDDGRLPIAAAAELLRLRKHPAALDAALDVLLEAEPGEVDAAAEVSRRLSALEWAKGEEERNAAREAKRQEAEAAARAAGARVLPADLDWDDAPQDMGRRHLNDDAAIQAARDAGQLGAYYTGRKDMQYVDLTPAADKPGEDDDEPGADPAQPVWPASMIGPPPARWSTPELPLPVNSDPAADSAGGVTADQVRAQGRAARESRESAEIARAAVCAQIVAELGNDPAAALPYLAGAAIAAADDGGRGDVLGDVAEVAAVWLRAAGVELLDEDTTYETLSWLDRHGDPALRYQVAGALALAAGEERLQGHTWSRWDSHDAAHLDRLIAAGHELSEWETDQLDQITDSCDYTPGCRKPYGHPGQCDPVAAGEQGSASA